MLALVVLQTVVLAVMVVLVAGLLKSHADILRKLHDLGIDSDSPTTPTGLRVAAGIAEPRLAADAATDISGIKSDGSAAAIGVVGTDHPTLLAFLSTSCQSCKGFWDSFDDPNLKLPGSDLRLVIVTKGPEAESESAVHRLAPKGITTIMSTEAYEDYQVPVSPFFVMIDGPTGKTLGEGASATWGQLESLLRQAISDSSSAKKRSRRRSGSARSQDADEVLIAAGINPGDPTLYSRPDQ